MHRLRFVAALPVLLTAVPSLAQNCEFPGSTAVDPASGKVELPWRRDYPTSAPTDPKPWEAVDFRQDWKGYMAAIIGTARAAGLRITSDRRLAMAAEPRWWMSLWMDYGPFGRERLAGLTKERSPDQSQLAPGSPKSRQVWAVGWYNAYGAFTLAQVFRQPCDPDVTKAKLFEEGTASFKLLFTDMEPTGVPYLQGSPEITAMIDPPGVAGGADPASRVERRVRLLQVDIAAKDRRAEATGWVLGTYVWIGPPKGDGFFDNLVPVSLQWGNDPDNTGFEMREGVINTDLKGIIYDWKERPWPGFRGRANGPADNLSSACLACHGTAQWPRSVTPGMVGKLPLATDGAAVEKHVKTYFRNIKAGELFDSKPPGAAPLDYSLQLQAGFSRLCTACRDGAIEAATPALCRMDPVFKHLGPTCAPASHPLAAMISAESAVEVVPPRQ
jgi:hypothetical protein